MKTYESHLLDKTDMVMYTEVCLAHECFRESSKCLRISVNFIFNSGVLKRFTLYETIRELSLSFDQELTSYALVYFPETLSFISVHVLTKASFSRVTHHSRVVENDPHLLKHLFNKKIDVPSNRCIAPSLSDICLNIVLALLYYNVYNRELGDWALVLLEKGIYFLDRI